jgi:tryptophanyl-tRNA synthetase
MSACTGDSIDVLVDEYGSGGYGAFKDAVANAVIAEVEPVKNRYKALNNGDVRDVLRSSGIRANESALRYMDEVRGVTGLKSY